jgi:uncharacterized protein (DUF1697 family)
LTSDDPPIYHPKRWDEERLAHERSVSQPGRKGASYKLNTPTIILSAEEIKELVLANPFRGISEKKSEKSNVTFFKHPPAKDKLPAQGRGFKGHGLIGKVYCYTVDMKAMKTPEAMLTLKKEFGKEITTRTWNTVLKIYKFLHNN